VRLRCLAHALRHEQFGVWGGATPEERDEMRGGPLPFTPEDGSEADRLRERLRRGVPHAQIAQVEGVSTKTIARWWSHADQPGVSEAA